MANLECGPNFGFDAAHWTAPGFVEAPNTGAAPAGQPATEETTDINLIDFDNACGVTDLEGGVMFKHPGEVTRMTPTDRAFRHIANVYAPQEED